MNTPFFSIIVVSLNAGEKLLSTIESIRRQSCVDYEVIVKDGGSKDGSIEALRDWQQGREDFPLRIVEEPDQSIYEGMNQGIAQGKGEYLYFLNCGDLFYAPDSLEKAKKGIQKSKEEGMVSLLYYGDIFDELRGKRVTSNPRIDAFACYRHLPCHQACLYDRVLFSQRGYRPEYRVRADYEHFLWSFFEAKANPCYLDVILASYEGGGFSETRENRIRSEREHREIAALYMTKGQILWYRTLLVLTLAPLRTRLAESKHFSGLYNAVRRLIYRG